jgi:hypothetical protein
MSTRDRLLRAFLWLSVLAWSTWVGGTLYQMLVIVPLWSENPPESVRALFSGNGANLNRTLYNFFGPPWMLVRVGPSLVALVLAWTYPAHRKWLGVVVAIQAAMVVVTLTYIYSINDVLFEQAGGQLSAAEVRQLTGSWILADRIRFAAGIVAFVALLHAFRLPLRRATDPSPN